MSDVTTAARPRGLPLLDESVGLAFVAVRGGQLALVDPPARPGGGWAVRVVDLAGASAEGVSVALDAEVPVADVERRLAESGFDVAGGTFLPATPRAGG